MQLIAAGPARQRRLTVAFRPILTIPHGFVLFFLNLAGLVVAFLGWWGALFMGRLPAFAVTYLSGLARWNARYYGYSYLLTDDYPPFKLRRRSRLPGGHSHPAAGRLNRFAVFFRFILAVWANIVSGPGDLRGQHDRGLHRLADHAHHREAAQRRCTWRSPPCFASRPVTTAT